MTYEKLKELADQESKLSDSDKFYYYFLECVEKVRELSDLYKAVDRDLKIKVKAHIQRYTETLKCFVDCTKTKKEAICEV